MTEYNEFQGKCLCGAVSLSVKAEGHSVAACHCHMCRTWSGGPMLALEGVTQVNLQGEEHLTVFASSEWAERGFCRECGTHLFYRLREGSHYAVPVGLVDQGEPWQFDTQIFIDDKPGLYTFANKTTNMTGQEVFEAFAGAPGNTP
ncbi:GFA family protein [Litchfieldella xinjiangensis]|uniref:GFA family protein n=1 Tax=Litchfieldella xinjiangensis TaxID=1166948 RepID=UPI0005BBFAED|nr:GFA family protein [Halomonas xinjiangensis]